MKKKIFICAIVATLIIPWFKLPQPEITGVETKHIFPSFTFDFFFKTTYQKNIEKWYTSNFGSRNTFLIAKNTIYELLNFGQFHSGHSGNILQGRKGVLFEKGYILSKFSKMDDVDHHLIAKDIVTSLSKFRNKLNEMGIEFFFIMAPSKADCREDAIPILWKYRQNHLQPSTSIYPKIEKLLHKENIHYINSLKEIQQLNLTKDAFPDSGIHWTMHCSAIILTKATEILNAKNKEKFPIVTICNVKKTMQSNYAERDIASLLNIYPRYNKGRTSWNIADFKPTEFQKSINALILGDSFSDQLRPNILRSGFSTDTKLIGRGNWLPSRDELFSILKKTDLVILTYTYPALVNNRIVKDISSIISCIDDVSFSEWYGHEKSLNGRWSKANSTIHFLNDGSIEHLLSFQILRKSKTANRVKIFVNNNIFHDIDLKNVSLPLNINIKIPQSILKQRENQVLVQTNFPSSPVSLGTGNDSRELGVFCNNFSISRQ
ncbi:hypothetical protein Despr_0535 [Desulfobulbus propionicus DSM 2032]|uniref:AlgX/AlgJ SGNH hydrolase-like domain-containing protein n=1 Tax=Desulfobulbus propionicus (strain ATCC 33891 / DSM 2032 / VKM B-1956 / 1pr3) TaxID=577650 RepID=A0A7U3YJV3_DESPD|nr:hypothetical protein [Desulfobulbus propionicus]ADW16714.1 hypothetical protein Despr_0535 [Desulfobulbus propionicus DSM 2032]